MSEHWSECELCLTSSLIGECSVIGCNSGDVLADWLDKDSVNHPGTKHSEETCTCQPPVVLWMFPKNVAERKTWTRLINRAGFRPTP